MFMSEKSPNYKKNLAMMATRSSGQVEELEQIERNAFANFSGQLDELVGALGMLRLGQHVGWRVLVLIHNKRTIRKYEEILGIKVRDYFPEEGPSADRSIGYKFVKKIGNYWKAVSGDIKVESRRLIDE